jgi:curved DNA-binding protein CbpA
MKDFYYILGTSFSDNHEEITETYQKLSQKLYPDFSDNDDYFRNRYLEIQEAYETLNDPIRRKLYDEQLRAYKASASSIPSKQHPYSKTKYINIAATLILVGFTILFGSYVIKSLYSTKKPKVNSLPIASAVTVKHKLWHPRKKHVKATYSFTATTPVKSKYQVKTNPALVNNPTTDLDTINVASSIATLPAVVESKASDEIETWEAEIRSNETGVVYMRESGRYNSAVIKVIPNHTKVQLLERGDKYFKVQLDNVAGYVPKWTVQLN